MIIIILLSSKAKPYFPSTLFAYSRLDRPPVAALALTGARAALNYIIIYFILFRVAAVPFSLHSAALAPHTRPTDDDDDDVHLARVCRTGPGAAAMVFDEHSTSSHSVPAAVSDLQDPKDRHGRFVRRKYSELLILL